MKEIRLGTIGTGEIVKNVLRGVCETPGISLYGVYSRSAEKGEALKKAFDGKKVFTELSDMLREEEINTVYVASPNSLHYEHTKKALLAGKHVICEKPLCPEVRQAKELFALAEENGLMLTEAVPTTFLPNYTVLRDALKEIGRLRLVCGNYTQYSSRYDRLRRGEVTNVFDPAFAGGCLMDINFYNVYLTVALFGAPQKALYFPNLRGGVDTSGVAHLHYPDFQVTLAGSKDSWGVSFFDIQGEDGCIRVEGGPNGLQAITLRKDGKETHRNLHQGMDRWALEIRNLIPMFLAEDRKTLKEKQEISVLTCKTIETMRKNCGIVFDGDKD